MMATYAADLSSSLEFNLIEKLKMADNGAFQELFGRFGQRIFRTAMRILREEESAKDAVQETMINIHRAADTFRGEARLGTWINRITVNVCLEMIRKNRKHANRIEEDISEYPSLKVSDEHDPYRETLRVEARRRLRKALGRLSRKHRLVVRMHDVEGFTIREIAEQVGVAEGTIKSRLFYGREELKRQLLV
jgi:RNA polymerase sigma-70 factor (ECF subfamily)